LSGGDLERWHGNRVVDHAPAKVTCPATPLGKDNPEGAPLEYHIRLLEVLPRDAGEARPAAASRLRPAGPGNAVFSVSSFMDTLAPTEDNADELMAAGAAS
jgi:hypothetical protein